MASVHQVSRQIEEAMKEKDAEAHATVGLESILHVISAALDGTEKGWLVKLTDQVGNLLFLPEEAEELEPQLEPLAEKLREMAFATQSQRQTQSGGDFGIDEMYEGFLQKLNFINQKFQDFARSSGILHMELRSDSRPDLHPVTPLLELLGGVLTPIIGPEALEAGVAIGQRIPLPFRVIVFFAYLGLDLVRILTSIPGFDIPLLRQLLAVVASTVDILRGDWKKALLSFAGFFRASFVWMGFLGKAFLDMFYLIAPDLQQQIGWGTLSIGKSMIVGLLLKCFQIFAPYELRKPVYDVFGNILNKQVCNATAVKELETTPAEVKEVASTESGASAAVVAGAVVAGAVEAGAVEAGAVEAPPSASEAGAEGVHRGGASSTASAPSANLAPSSEPPAELPATPASVDARLSTNVGGIQSAIAQPSTVCSSEIQDIVAIASHSIFLRIALQLMRIPTTLEGLHLACKRLYDYVGSDRTWLAFLIAEGAADYLAVERDKSKDPTHEPSKEEKAKKAMPHNQVKELKAQLDQYRKKLKEIDAKVVKANADLKSLKDNTFPLPGNSITTDAIIAEVFPQQVIQSMFPDLNYTVFVLIIKYVIKVNYKNKQIEGTGGFQKFKEQPEFFVDGKPLTDDTIIQYIRPLYILFSNKMKGNDKYKLLHAKLFEVDRIMNAIKLKEWALLQPTLENIEAPLKKAYQESEKDRVTKETQGIVNHADTERKATQAAIEQVENKIIGLIEKSFEESHKKMAEAADKELQDKALASAKQEHETRTAEEAAKAKAEAAAKAAAETAKKAEIEKQVKEQVAILPPAAPLSPPPIPDSPYAVATAITQAIGNVLGRVQPKQSIVSAAKNRVGSLFSSASAPAVAAVEEGAVSAPVSAVSAASASVPGPNQLGGGGTRKRKLVRRQLTKKVRFDLKRS